MVSEEDKGLGAFGFDTRPGEPCELPDQHSDEDEGSGGPDPDETCLPFDEGKNTYYHTFSMSIGDTVGKDKPSRTASWPT